MKLPLKRETVATGKVKNGYATYSSWEDSVIDYFLWQNYMLRTKEDLTEKQYLAFIGKIYATDPRYLVKVKEKMKLYGHLVE
jgi:flagellum-specific peptidoglycan hydrolase FlgJ